MVLSCPALLEIPHKLCNCARPGDVLIPSWSLRRCHHPVQSPPLGKMPLRPSTFSNAYLLPEYYSSVLGPGPSWRADFPRRSHRHKGRSEAGSRSLDARGQLVFGALICRDPHPAHHILTSLEKHRHSEPLLQPKATRAALPGQHAFPPPMYGPLVSATRF